MKTRKPSEIEQLVDRYLQRHTDDMGGIHARTLPGTARLESHTWWVAVKANKEPPRKFEFYDVLTNVEDELRENEHLDVLIVPSGHDRRREKD